MNKKIESKRATRNEKGILLAVVSLLGAALGVTATTPADAKKVKTNTTNSGMSAGPTHTGGGMMAAGTQDAMKKVYKTDSGKGTNPKGSKGIRAREPGTLEVPNKK